MNNIHPIFADILNGIKTNPNLYAGGKPMSYDYEEHESSWQLGADWEDEKEDGYENN